MFQNGFKDEQKKKTLQYKFGNNNLSLNSQLFSSLFNGNKGEKKN